MFIREQCLFCSKLPIVWHFFKGGRRLLEGDAYMRKYGNPQCGTAGNYGPWE